MVKFHETLSEESVHFRYFGFVELEQRVAHERLTRICFNDYDREIAMVATRHVNNEEEIIGSWPAHQSSRTQRSRVRHCCR